MPSSMPCPSRATALLRLVLLPALLLASLPVALGQSARPVPRAADYIVAVVDQELVTNAEVQQRMAATQRDAAQRGERLPPDAELRRQLLDAMIDERAQLSHARESGVRIDDAELDRAVANVAQQNRFTLAQLRERLQSEGLDFARFRNNVRDQMLLERIREREVNARIKISDAEIDAQLATRKSGAAPDEYNIAQLLVSVPEGATVTELAQAKARAEQALARARAGEDFTKLVAELASGAKEQGGALGLRPAERLPDAFVAAVAPLKAGQVAPQVLRTGAGFHVLKLVERRDGGNLVIQTRARHILLRTSAQLSQPAALARLAEFKQQVESGRADFAQLARANSEDGSAAQGGDLGWASPGQFVPEFEEAMSKLAPNEMSAPLVSRFGVHLIQVLERRSQPVDKKQQREVALNLLREKKFEAAYADWAREIRARAYVELREPPQ